MAPLARVRQVWAAFNDYYSPGNERGGFVLVADLTGSGTPNIIADTAVWDVNGTLLNNRRNGRMVVGLALANLDDSGQTAIISHELGNQHAATSSRASPTARCCGRRRRTLPPLP